MTSKRYYMRIDDGRAYGPVDEKTLRTLVAKGRLTANYSVALSKDGPWHTVYHICRRVVIDIEGIGDAESAIMGRHHAFYSRHGCSWN
jgi:hypothetical protein